MVLWFWLIVIVIIVLLLLFYKVQKNSQNSMEKNAAENRELEKQRRVTWLNEISKKADSISSLCDRNDENAGTLVSVDFKSDIQMKQILQLIAATTELQGEINAMAKDVEQRGDVSI